MNLQLSLKTKWFELTDALVKPEDYRDITPYWCSRFVLVEGYKKSQKWWNKKIEHPDFLKWLSNNIEIGAFNFVKFTTNIMTLGYPKLTDTERIIQFKHVGIEIRTGNPEWGARPDKLYFVIKHGKKI